MGAGHDFVPADAHFGQAEDARPVMWLCLDCSVVTGMLARARARRVCPVCRHSEFVPLGYMFTVPLEEGMSMFPDDWHDGDERLLAWFCGECEVFTFMPQGARLRGAVCCSCHRGNLKPHSWGLLMPMHVHDREHKGFIGVGDL